MAADATDWRRMYHEAEVEGERLAELEAAGLCLICESAPVRGDDCMCAECRQFTTDSSSTVIDPVERVINDHWLFAPLCSDDRQLCRCGWEIDSGPAYHRRHMAEMVYQALRLDGPVPWVDGPLVKHPTPRLGGDGD